VAVAIPGVDLCPEPTELRRTVKTVSYIYERAFPVRFAIQDVVPWTIGPGVPLATILRRLHREVPIGSADALVGFAAERCRYRIVAEPDAPPPPPTR
jgi:hypothetical protein